MAHRTAHHNGPGGVLPKPPIAFESPKTGVRVVVGTQGLVTVSPFGPGPQRSFREFKQSNDLHGWSADDEIAVLIKAGWREVE